MLVQNTKQDTQIQPSAHNDLTNGPILASQSWLIHRPKDIVVQFLRKINRDTPHEKRVDSSRFLNDLSFLKTRSPHQIQQQLNDEFFSSFFENSQLRVLHQPIKNYEYGLC